MDSNGSNKMNAASASMNTSRSLYQVSQTDQLNQFRVPAKSEQLNPAILTWNQLRDIAKRHLNVAALSKKILAPSNAPNVPPPHPLHTNPGFTPKFHSKFPKSLSSAEMFALIKSQVFSYSPSVSNTNAHVAHRTLRNIHIDETDDDFVCDADSIGSATNVAHSDSDSNNNNNNNSISISNSDGDSISNCNHSSNGDSHSNHVGQIKPDSQDGDHSPSDASTCIRSQTEVNISAETLAIQDRESEFFCTLCVDLCPATGVHQLMCCGCIYCVSCLSTYVKVNVEQHGDLLRLSCPSLDCPSYPNNLLSEHEVRALCSDTLFALYQRLRKQQQVACDPKLVWCPRPDCEGVCQLPENWFVNAKGEVNLLSSDHVSNQDASSSLSELSACSTPSAQSGSASSDSIKLGACERIPVQCGVCHFTFCAHCRRAFHHQLPCQSRSEDESLALLLKRTSTGTGNALQIKRCPRCAVYIQRDQGCAQMMCCKCKHVFCWFCLQSLEEDLLLRHYDSGPCKNKLGHSRLSVFWHRTQVVAILIGLVLLLLLISPIFLVLAPFAFCFTVCFGTAVLHTLGSSSIPSTSDSEVYSV